MPATQPRILIIGAGIGGLTAGLDLARQGADVTILERAPTIGGKMRQVPAGSGGPTSAGGAGQTTSGSAGGLHPTDAGPTVFTMRWVFDALLADAGASLDAELTLRPAHLLARHAWNESDRLDLFADIEESADAIAAFAGPAEARGYRAFCARAQRIYDSLETPFLKSSQPGSPFALVRRAGVADMLAIAAFSTLWRSLGAYFRDPRLRQLFGRYATYNGSSPYLAPATLMLIAHVERAGVWLVEGGMFRVAEMLARLATNHGATIRTQSHVTEIGLTNGRATHATLATGERIDADAIILNADPAALTAGLFGPQVAAAVPRLRAADRSLSALTWVFRAETTYPLAHHTVIFGDDYAREFTDIFTHHRAPTGNPTIYICAQDRNERGEAPPGPERLFLLVNAPAQADTSPLPPAEITECQTRTFQHLQRCGVILTPEQTPTLTGPQQFHSLFPATGGALYGQAVHGTTAAFKRPGSATKIPRLYLAGGSTHPGAGVPMAALSGRLAASHLMEDLASTAR